MGEIIDFEEAIKKLSDDDLGEIIKFAAKNIKSQRVNKKDIFSELTECYIELLSELKIREFSNVVFPDYEDPRLILVDSKEINLDDAFTRKEENARGVLYEIDALIGDLVCDYHGNSQEKVLKTIEKKLSNKKGE